MWRTQNKVERAKCGDRLRNTICISCCTLSSLWPSTTTLNVKIGKTHMIEREMVFKVISDHWSDHLLCCIPYHGNWPFTECWNLNFLILVKQIQPIGRVSVCGCSRGYLITDQPPIVPHPMPRSLSHWLLLAQSVKLPDWSSLQESVLILKDFVHMLLSSFPRLCNLNLAIFSRPCLVW